MTKQALHKIEEFVKVALSEISELQNKLSSLQVKQAAEAMYNSDFINDEDEKAMFVKKAKEDSKYLAQVVERVCNAADVAYMGKVATVKSSIQSDDPVMRRAFGNGGSYSLLDADHEF
jgi:phage-related protein